MPAVAVMPVAAATVAHNRGGHLPRGHATRA